jgi:hypothetical protein
VIKSRPVLYVDGVTTVWKKELDKYGVDKMLTQNSSGG